MELPCLYCTSQALNGDLSAYKWINEMMIVFFGETGWWELVPKVWKDQSGKSIHSTSHLPSIIIQAFSFQLPSFELQITEHLTQARVWVWLDGRPTEQINVLLANCCDTVKVLAWDSAGISWGAFVPREICSGVLGLGYGLRGCSFRSLIMAFEVEFESIGGRRWSLGEATRCVICIAMASEDEVTTVVILYNFVRNWVLNVWNGRIRVWE